MSVVPQVCAKTVFHRIMEVSVIDEESTLSDLEIEEEPYFSDIEIDEMKSERKIPALNVGTKFWLDEQNEINLALLKAAEQGKHELCEELLSSCFFGTCEADVNYRDARNWTALHIAGFSGHVDVCKLLLSQADKIEIDAVNDQGLTALQLSCIQGHLEVSHLLVKTGAKINLRDALGNTLLHLASSAGHPKVVSWLMLLKPDLTCLNFNNQTAEEVAAENCKYSFVQYREIQLMIQERPLSGKQRASYPMVTSKKTKQSNPFSHIG